jgi:hypothetical protein
LDLYLITWGPAAEIVTEAYRLVAPRRLLAKLWV